jgi:hypothetical protein
VCKCEETGIVWVVNGWRELATFSRPRHPYPSLSFRPTQPNPITDLDRHTALFTTPTATRRARPSVPSPPPSPPLSRRARRQRTSSHQAEEGGAGRAEAPPVQVPAAHLPPAQLPPAAPVTAPVAAIAAGLLSLAVEQLVSIGEYLPTKQRLGLLQLNKAAVRGPLLADGRLLEEITIPDWSSRAGPADISRLLRLLPPGRVRVLRIGCVRLRVWFVGGAFRSSLTHCHLQHLIRLSTLL